MTDTITLPRGIGEYLMWVLEESPHHGDWSWNDCVALDALRTALAAEPTKQEPGLMEGLTELARQMKPLDADMAAILHNNLDSLYIEDEPALAADPTKPSEEVEALRLDAERYRWLREWMVRHSILCLEYGDRWALRKPHFISSSVGCGETEDAAIDAAMAQDKR